MRGNGHPCTLVHLQTEEVATALLGGGNGARWGIGQGGGGGYGCFLEQQAEKIEEGPPLARSLAAGGSTHGGTRHGCVVPRRTTAKEGGEALGCLGSGCKAAE